MDFQPDTSSYPKPPALPAQQPLLDQVGKYQQLQSNQIGIQKQQLDLMNQHFQLMNNDLSTLLDDSSTTKDDVATRMTARMKTFNSPPELINQMNDELQKAPDAHTFLTNTLVRGMDTNERINKIYGANGGIDTGQTIIPTRTPTGQGPIQTGQPIQKQIPPATAAVDENNQPRLVGPQPAQAAPGSVTTPSPLPVGPINPAGILGQSSNFGGNVLGANVEPPTPNQTVQNRSMTPTGPAAGVPPMFDEGKKQLANDQNVATQKLTGIKNAQKVLALLPGVASGPGTGPYQQALAFLKAQGILSTDPKDKTVVYQEINKYLNRYVQQSGLSQRSDAAQALAENSNPNLMTQLNPALINLTQNAIALDKVEAARPSAFTGAGRKDYNNYGQFSSSFPQSQDERAYGLSDLPKPQAQQLYQSMKAKALAGDPEGIRFMKSLDIAHKQGM